MNLLAPVIRPVAAWAESSQRAACRNAMVASTALSDRLRDRREVQEYVAQTLALRATKEHADPGLRVG